MVITSPRRLELSEAHATWRTPALRHGVALVHKLASSSGMAKRLGSENKSV